MESRKRDGKGMGRDQKKIFGGLCLKVFRFDENFRSMYPRSSTNIKHQKNMRKTTLRHIKLNAENTW